MERILVSELRKNFNDVVKLVVNGRRRVLVRDGKTDRAALISLDDLALLESLDEGGTIPVEHVPAEEVRKHLRDDLEEVANRHERIVLQEKGQDLAALVPQRDVAFLENLDTRIGIEAAKRLLNGELE